MSDPAQETELAQRLWTVRTKDDVQRLLEMAEQIYGSITTKPVGGRPNNSGIIRVSSDPMLAIVERITNAIDACLELKAKTINDSAPNPRDAARKWFHIPEGGLAKMDDGERRALAQNVFVTLEESGVAKRPTIVVTDAGVGIHPADFEDTILSLNASNKIQAPYTMGAFGQGGSATFGFSAATVIVSRLDASQLAGRHDLIGWTIVMERYDDASMKVPSWEFYLPANGSEVFALDPSYLTELAHGTRVSHVAYDAQRGAAAFTTGAWQLLNATLFDPILPFILGGNRRDVDPEWKEGHVPTRVITGTATRLSGEDVGGTQIELAHHDSVHIDLDDENGSVTLKYWVLTRPEGATAARDAARSYVDANTAVSMTLFGQRQDAMPRTWIKDKVRLPFLFKNMVVQIDADRLTMRAKRELFSSTRERATESDLKQRIYEEVADLLSNDEMLRHLNYQEKERLLRKSAEATNEKVRKRLARFVKTKLKNAQRQGEGGVAPGQGGTRSMPSGAPSSPRDISDEHLPNFPTSIKFDKRQVTVRQGRKTSVWVHVNAKNGYLPTHDEHLTLRWEPEPVAGQVRVASRSTLRGGKSSWQIAATGDASLGEYTLTAELVTPSGYLVDTLLVSVASPLPAPKENPSTEPETGPDVRWVRKDEWGDFEFTERSVGRVDEVEGATIIWVNRDYRLLEQALSGRSLTADAIQSRADRYQYPVACAIWFQNHEVKKLDAKVRPSPEYLEGELERIAEAVLLASDPDVALADESAPEDT